MIKEFVNKWDKYKGDLEDYFRNNKQLEYDCYEEIVKLLFEKVINRDIQSIFDSFFIDDINIVDDGDYQGTKIFILHKNSYNSSIYDYVYTSVYYGSCSGCDILLKIQSYDLNEFPNEEQVKDYMTLALHLLQNCNYMEGE